MSHLSGVEPIQNQSEILDLSSQMFNQSEVHLGSLIVIIPSGHAISVLTTYCITWIILLQLNVKSKSI